MLHPLCCSAIRLKRVLQSLAILFWYGNLLFSDHRTLQAQEIEFPAARLLPPTCVLYAQVARPQDLISDVLDHPLRAKIESLQVWQQAITSQPYRNFLTGRKFFEVQMGMDWRPAIEALTAGGVYAALDGPTQGAVLLVRGRDEQVMQTFQMKILELLRLGKDADKATDDYRGVTVYKLDKGGAAVVGEWLVVVNKGEPGRFVLDRLLDAQNGEQTSETLADNPRLLDAFIRTSSPSPEDKNSEIWAFADLQVIREAEDVNRKLQGSAENPLVEMLVGGIQSALQKTPWVAAQLMTSVKSHERFVGPAVETSLVSGVSGIRLSLTTPFSEDWIPEERHHFFGTEPEGHAPVLPSVTGQILSVAVWRDVSEMWLRAGDLFDENTNDQLANAESTLTTLFAGRDFAEEILGSFQPETGLIVARQDFGDMIPQPAVKLPSFALVLQMREPQKMTRELRRTFQSMIGFFNVIGAMEGRPQLEMNMRALGTGEIVTSQYIPEEDDEDSMAAPLIFNFSPSVAFSGSRFVVSSTAQLAEQLALAITEDSDPQGQPNTAVRLSAGLLQQVLMDNRDQLISQNMLEEGRSREEAETHIDLLLRLVGYFHSVGLQLNRQSDQLKLELDVLVGTGE